jgi:hypothetical protein
MQVLYMNMPELPHTRHVIVGDRHIINTAAPETNIFHKVQPRVRQSAPKKKTAPRRAEQ